MLIGDMKRKSHLGTQQCVPKISSISNGCEQYEDSRRPKLTYMRYTLHYIRLFSPGLLAKVAAFDKLIQRPLRNILFSSYQIPRVRHNPKTPLANSFLVEDRAGAGALRRRLLSARESGALSALDDERCEQVLWIFPAQAELSDFLYPFWGSVVALRQNDLELNKVCDVENWRFAICNAGAFQRPFEVGQALSFLPIVGNFGSALGAQVS